MMTMSSSIRVKPLSQPHLNSCAPEFAITLKHALYRLSLSGLPSPSLCLERGARIGSSVSPRCHFVANCHDNPATADFSREIRLSDLVFPIVMDLCFVGAPLRTANLYIGRCEPTFSRGYRSSEAIRWERLGANSWSVRSPIRAENVR